MEGESLILSMKHKIFLGLLLYLGLIVGCNQAEEIPKEIKKEKIKTPEIEFVKIVSLTGVYQLAFAKMDSVFNTFYEPYIFVGQKKYELEGFRHEGPSTNRSNGQIIALSPDGDYAIIQLFSFPCIDDVDEVMVNSNEYCAILDIKNKRLIHKMFEHFLSIFLK